MLITLNLADCLTSCNDATYSLSKQPNPVSVPSTAAISLEDTSDPRIPHDSYRATLSSLNCSSSDVLGLPKTSTSNSHSK